MIVSMTGFGHATVENEAVRAEASVRSLNHRFLEVSFRGPRAAAVLEPELRALVQSQLRRGRVEVVLSWERRATNGGRVRVVPDVVAALAGRASELKHQHGLGGELTIGDVIRFPGALEIVEEEAGDTGLRAEGVALVARALDGLVAMRRAEGARLEAELRLLLANIEVAVAQIATLDVVGRGERDRQLRERVAELLDAQRLEDGRAYAEVAKLVEKSDITEELARLRGHVAAAAEACAGSQPSGKRLDFLSQELAREANTIASKGGSLTVVHAAVALKSEIERFREQVQNVE